MEISPLQESLLNVLPYWNYRISKPLKHLLDDGMSLEMYYCLQMMQRFDDTPTMSALGQRVKMSKQQMTKIVNRLAERGFIERVYDPLNRRIIKIKITQEAIDYMDKFHVQHTEYFQEMLQSMSEEDQKDFKQAIDTILRILSKKPCE